MKVGELKELLTKWRDTDEVEISCALLADREGLDYIWLELITIDEGFLGSGEQDLCLLETGKVMGEG